MANKKTHRGISNARVAGGIGLGLAAAAGVAGAIFLYGKSGSKNRKKVKAWTLKAKAEILKKLKQAKELNQPIYNKIVDQVAGRYRSLKHVEVGELAEMAKELKAHWKTIARHPSVKRAARKPARKSREK